MMVVVAAAAAAAAANHFAACLPLDLLQPPPQTNGLLLAP